MHKLEDEKSIFNYEQSLALGYILEDAVAFFSAIYCKSVIYSKQKDGAFI